MTTEQWGELKKQLLETVGESNYRNWIEPLQFVDSTGGVARIAAPTNFAGTYVSRNYGDLILHRISSFDSGVRRIEFSTAPANTQAIPAARRTEAAAAAGAAAAPGPAAAPARRPVSARESMLPPAPLDSRFTFDTFVVGKPNELAHAAARRVAEGGPVTFNPARRT